MSEQRNTPNIVKMRVAKKAQRKNRHRQSSYDFNLKVGILNFKYQVYSLKNDRSVQEIAFATIITPISRNLLNEELNECDFVRHSCEKVLVNK